MKCFTCTNDSEDKRSKGLTFVDKGYDELFEEQIYLCDLCADRVESIVN